MPDYEDPLQAAINRRKELRKELAQCKADIERLSTERRQWPKIVQVSVSKGKWGEEVLEAFAEACGWTPREDACLGPVSDGKFICGQAWLYYEAQENGVLKLVGAQDQTFGKVGVVPDEN